MPPLIAPPDWSDTATLTTNSENAQAPVTNLQTLQPKEIYMALTDTGVFVQANHGSQAPWNLVFLGFHNLTSSGTVRIRAANTSAALTTAPLHDSTALPAWQGQDLTTWIRRHFLYWASPAVTSQYIRIDLDDATNPDGVLWAGRLYVSNAWVAPHNMQLGMQTGSVDLAVIQESALDGTTHVREVATKQISQFTLGYLTEAQYMALDDILRVRGAHKDILLVEETPPMTFMQKKIKYGLVNAVPAQRPHISRYEQRIEMRELI